ncbi:MAG: hypothetical protein KF819_26035 [Labilithrix sp.]|nr:hypothetical protein [Labilithrix sp.]
MLGIPPAKDTDAEDVVWGLQTAEALWKRGERIDAVVWLRRAAQAAGEAADDDRALELARYAAELTDWMATLPAGQSGAPPPAPTFVPDGGPTSIDVDVEVDGALAPPPPPAPFFPPPTALPAAPPFREQSSPTIQMASPEGMVAPRDDAPEEHAPVEPPPAEPEPPAADRSDDAEEPRLPATTSVPPAEAVHAGMFNPWDADAPPPPVAAPPAPLPRFGEEEEVVTSVRPHALAQQRADELAAQAAPSPRPPSAAARPAPPRPPPLPPRARAKAPAAPQPPREPDGPTGPFPVQPEVHAPPPPVTPPPPSPTQVMSTPSAPPSEPTNPNLGAPSAPDEAEVANAPEALAPAPAPARPPKPEKLVLDDVEAFADLPDDAREAFAAAASVDPLGEGEEVSSFALAYVIAGKVDVAATMVDAPAVRLEAGAVLRSRGTTEGGVPMRLICASNDSVVATWSDAEVTEAFRSIPWVEDDLRAAADRVQTLVGITIGPLGERLDASIREQIVERLTMRPLSPGEIVVNAGEVVPGLLLVGVGEIELVQGDEVSGVVGSGEFLFPGEVLGAGDAPATARAGAGGALIMSGDRRIAQELLVTCPPLVEVLAGM